MFLDRMEKKDKLRQAADAAFVFQGECLSDPAHVV